MRGIKGVPRRQLTTLVAIALAVLAATVHGACSSEERSFPGPVDAGTGGSSGAGASGGTAGAGATGGSGATGGTGGATGGTGGATGGAGGFIEDSGQDAQDDAPTSNGA